MGFVIEPSETLDTKLRVDAAFNKKTKEEIVLEILEMYYEKKGVE